MLRGVAVIYLVLVTAAGPGLCCCSFTHLIARAAETHEVDAELPSCCQTHTQTGGEQPQHHKGCPRDRGDPSRPGCPCRHAPDPVLVDRPVETPGQAQAAYLLVAPFFGAAEAGHPGARAVPALPGSPLPALTAWETLCLRHQLRC